tara:strand:+ start:6213 stop:7799 length:1587 start_codon:yes stop_codon:yes gene_type:complete
MFAVGGLFLLAVVLSQLPWEGRVLLPSIFAAVSVFVLQRALVGLLLGAALGCLMLSGLNPWRALMDFFNAHLLPSLKSEWNLSVLIFTLLLGGFAALVERGGGFRALFQSWIHGAPDSGRRVQWSAYVMGLICFFDGLANSMMVGKSVGPVAKRCGISREKLAYIVDSTSSAVACVAIISTWIAYQLSMIREGFAQAKIADVNAFQVFVQSIPLNFYCWFTLILLAVVVHRNWNLGPMKSAERELSNSSDGEADNTEASAWAALVPLAVLMAVLMGCLYFLGAKEPHPVTWSKLWSAFGAAPANQALLYASALACMAAFAFNARAIRRGGSPAGEVFLGGVSDLFVPCLILVAAWALSSTVKALGAADYLTQILTGAVSVAWFPTIVFGAGMLISFTTGTSWGTMGILMPLVIPVALGLASSGDAVAGAKDWSLVPPVVAAVFSGAVFGDHCSPLSDTTIVSSMACDLEPTRHVVTQLPYALTAAAIAVVVGFIPSGFGLPGIVCLALGAIIIILLPRIVPPAAPAAD